MEFDLQPIKAETVDILSQIYFQHTPAIQKDNITVYTANFNFLDLNRGKIL